MDDFGLLARDFGYKPQGKSAPMKSTRSPPSSSDHHLFNDVVFTDPPKFTTTNNNNTRSADIDYDSIFQTTKTTKTTKSVGASDLPVFDKPVYDDEDADEDIFDGLPGVKSSRSSSKSMFSGLGGEREDVFGSVSDSDRRRQRSETSDHFDDLLGNLGRTEKVEAVRNKGGGSAGGFDDLLPGFGSASGNRSDFGSVPVSTNTKATSNATDDPFVVLESTTPISSSQGDFTDSLKPIPKVSKSQSTKAGRSSVKSSVFDDLDPLHEFSKPAPAFSSENNNRKKDESPSKEGPGMGRSKSSTRREPTEKVSFKFTDSQAQKMHAKDFQQPVFDMPSVNRATSPPSYTESNSHADMSPSTEEPVQAGDDIWLTVFEVPLLTQPTRAPPPSRPPPPIPRHSSKFERGHFASNTRTSGNDSPNSARYSQSFNPFNSPAKSPVASPLDDFESFAMGGSQSNGDNTYGEEIDTNSASAAMKDAMDRAEAKFRHAKELRERDNAKASRFKESVKPQKDEMSTEETKHQQREREELEKEKERERIRLERERERQAVDRATREARERAGAEAREKASAEARLKAQRAAVQRAQAEARERAAIDAKERAERAAREARERASTEASEKAAAEAMEKAAREKAAVARAEADARRRAERIAVERVTAGARERAAAEARDRAAAAAAATAAAKINQQKNDNDLESFFSSRASSAPRASATSDPAPDPQSQNRRGQEGSQRASTTGVSSNLRKASSTTNIVDDLSSIFGAAPSSTGQFQDVEGETEERRRARLERQQRTQERAAKALAEKNNRDLQSQRDQEERDRISESLDIEIKRWAAGKEANLRALLSTLQYVLWPGCGWQPVSLTDLITGANVKKAYRKATLCIHPDKVQQKGANLQQKYVAEKVFDLLKEAWNKFNSEELF